MRRLDLLDTPLEERFERITRMAQTLLKARVAAVSLLDAERQFFKSIQGLDLEQGPRQTAFCAHTILEDEILLVPDARLDPRFSENPLVKGPPNIVFYAGYPLHSPDGHRVGALCVVDSETREFGEAETQLLMDLAALADMELRAASANAVQAELIEQLSFEHRRALIDPLTRVWNREGILRLASETVDRVADSEEGAAFLLLDLDRFKTVNDTLGHAVGDRVLRIAVRRMLSAIRETDVVGRLGGDEFLIVLSPCSSAKSAMALAERIRRRFTSAPIRLDDDELRVTSSVGVRYLSPGTRADFDAVMDSVDEMMYHAKRSGAGRVVVAPPDRPAA